MNRMTCVLIGILLLAGVVQLNAHDGYESSNRSRDRQVELRFRMLGDVGVDEPDPNAPGGSEDAARRKNPSVGILLSAAIPGAGEVYAGKYLKGAILLGVETVLWIGYATWQKKGNDLEADFREYADTHWSEERWLQNKKETDPDTHTLPDTKTQQYYEMIGKYDQFKAGWDDYYEGGPALTSNRDDYEHMRDDSNDFFKRASYSSMFAIANRLFSVFDTAFTIRRINREAEAGLRMGWMESGTVPVPCLKLQIDW